MLFEQGQQALELPECTMQKAAYYENPGLFGGYGYSKATDTYGYNAPHQPYPPPAAANSLDTDYPGSACSIQSSAPLRAPAHKGTELNGSCMRPGTGSSQGGGGGSQPPGLNSEQQPPQPPPPPPTLPPSSPTNPGAGVPAKKPKGGPNVSGSSATISKQIFPWMKESRQNSKQKNSCATAGSFLRGLTPGLSLLQTDPKKLAYLGTKRFRAGDATLKAIVLTPSDAEMSLLFSLLDWRSYPYSDREFTSNPGCGCQC